MNGGYERLSHKEAGILWDGWKEKKLEKQRPEEDLDEFFGNLIKSLEPDEQPIEHCDLYDRCGECPNFEDCYSFSISQVSSKVA